jgi:hypothetical protein
VSPNFALDTRDAIGTTVAESAVFTVDTRDANSTTAAVSGVFILDTRALTGQTGSSESNTFPLDTRGSLPVSLGFQQTSSAFGSKAVGTLTDKTFTITNNSNTTIFGTISVTAPFSILGDNTYNLAPGQSQTITIRFSPSAAGSYTGYVVISGGGGGTWQITASAYADPTASTGSISGVVTDSVTHQPINGVRVTAYIPTSVIQLPSGPNTTTGVIGGQAGSYNITGIAPSNSYRVQAVADGYYAGYYLQAPLQVVAGGAANQINITLTPIPPTVLPTPVVPMITMIPLGSPFEIDGKLAS